jgi:hypothetical protein
MCKVQKIREGLLHAGTYSVVSSSSVVCISLITVTSLQLVIANKFTSRFVVVAKVVVVSARSESSASSVAGTVVVV